MAGRGRTTFKKRQKEQLRLERRQQKAAKMLERKTLKENPPAEPELEFGQDLDLEPGQDPDLEPGQHPELEPGQDPDLEPEHDAGHEPEKVTSGTE